MDFEASTRAWESNKIRKGAVYVYRCMAIRTNGNRCTQPALEKFACSMYDGPLYCKNHIIHKPLNNFQ